MKPQSGLTLVELMVVVTLIAIILAIATMNFTQWNDKYTVESYVKDIYSLLMKARNDAANTNIQRLVTLTGNPNQVQTVEDTNNNSAFDAGEPSTTKPYPRFVIADVNGNPLNTTIIFSRRGITTNNQTFRITGYSPNASPGVDCIVIAQTRINMGRWDPTKPAVPEQRCVQ